MASLKVDRKKPDAAIPILAKAVTELESRITDKGIVGPPGPQGEKGEPGIKGDKGDAGADWILEIGKIGEWSYEKWNSGKAVIWIARLNITFPAATAWGSTGINKQIGTFSFPAIFINTPFVFGSIAGAIDVAAAPRVYALSATTGEAEHLRRTASAGTTGYSILAIGQWK